MTLEIHVHSEPQYFEVAFEDSSAVTIRISPEEAAEAIRRFIVQKAGFERRYVGNLLTVTIANTDDSPPA